MGIFIESVVSPNEFYSRLAALQHHGENCIGDKLKAYTYVIWLINITMRSIRRRYTNKPTLLALIATIAIISTYYVHNLSPQFVSAQTAKFASRSKLVDDESNKKKRSFFGKRTTRQVVKEEKRDGEWYSWSRGQTMKMGGGYNDNKDDVSWKWELFVAESRFILVSVIASIVCAILSLVWYTYAGVILQPGIQLDKKREEGGEYSSYILPPLCSSG